MRRLAALRKAETKEKKTYSLSGETVDFLEQVRIEGRHASTSAALEELIREKKLEAERARIDAAISAYYDSLSEEDREQGRAWGKFAESQFPTE